MKKRSDALENRDELLHAATAVFAEHGFDVALARIAERAGVSRTTLYRHFEDREALAVAIFGRDVEILEAAAPRLRADPDGFREMLGLAVDYFCRSAGLAEAMVQRDTRPDIGALRARVIRLLVPLARTAHAGGRLSRRLTAADIAIVLDILGAIARDRPLAERPKVLRQALRLMWDGLAAPGVSG